MKVGEIESGIELVPQGDAKLDLTVVEGIKLVPQGDAKLDLTVVEGIKLVPQVDAKLDLTVVEGIKLVPQVDANLELMVETLKQLSSGSSFLSIDEHEALDSLEASLEAHRQPGMPPGAFALFFPYGYLGLAIAAYNRVAGSKGKN